MSSTTMLYPTTHLMIRKIVRERPLGLAIVGCAIVRVVFCHLYGLSYDPGVPWWQMLDIELLRTAPLESIYFMHMQPPLLNLLYAAALALPGDLGFIVLHALFVGSSLTIVALLYVFLRRLNFRPYSASFASSLFGVLPQVLLYENIYFYSHLEAVLVLAAAVLAALYFEHRTISLFVGFAACLVVLGLLRSVFHLGWIALVLFSSCILSYRHPRWDRRMVVVSVLAIFLVGTVYLKNLKEFGIFSASSWDGLSLMSMALPTRAGDAIKFPNAIEDIRLRAADGELSPSTKAALDAVDIWRGWAGAVKSCDRANEQRRALCAIERSDGKLNFNHIAIIDYSRNLQRDAFYLMWLYPRVYLEHAGSSFFTFVGTPSWDFQVLPLRLKMYTNVWNNVLLYKASHASRIIEAPSGTWWAAFLNRLATSSIPLLLVVIMGSIFIIVAGIQGAIGYWQGRQSTADWFFPMFVVVLFCLVPNLINGAEAHRMRYSIEPLIYLSFITCVFRTGKWGTR